MEDDDMLPASSGRAGWFTAGSVLVVAALAAFLYYDGYFTSKTDVVLEENTPPLIIEGN